MSDIKQRIATLMSEADAAGDDLQVALCTVALDGDISQAIIDALEWRDRQRLLQVCGDLSAPDQQAAIAECARVLANV